MPGDEPICAPQTPAPIGYYFEPGLPCVLFVRVCARLVAGGTPGSGGKGCEKAELSKNSQYSCDRLMCRKVPFRRD